MLSLCSVNSNTPFFQRLPSPLRSGLLKQKLGKSYHIPPPPKPSCAALSSSVLPRPCLGSSPACANRLLPRNIGFKPIQESIHRNGGFPSCSCFVPEIICMFHLPIGAGDEYFDGWALRAALRIVRWGSRFPGGTAAPVMNWQQDEPEAVAASGCVIHHAFGSGKSFC